MNGYIIRITRRLILPAVMLYLIVTIALCVFCYVISTNTVITYKIEMWTFACQYIDFFLPLISCILFVPHVYMLKKKDFIRYASVRMHRKKYVGSQMISVYGLTILLTFLTYYSALIFSLFILKPQTIGNSSDLLSYVFGKSQVNHPLLFGMIWCIWKGMVSALFAGFGCMLALYSDNLFVATLLPFLYCMAENLITALLQIPQYSIMTSYVLNRLTPACMSVWNYLAGVMIFIFAAFLMIYFQKRRFQNVFS